MMMDGFGLDVSKGGVIKAIIGRAGAVLAMILTSSGIVAVAAFVEFGDATVFTRLQWIIQTLVVGFVLAALAMGIALALLVWRYAAQARAARDMARHFEAQMRRAYATMRSPTSAALLDTAETGDEVTKANYVQVLEDMAETAQRASSAWDEYRKEADATEREHMLGSLDHVLCRLMSDLNRVGEFERYPVGGFTDEGEDAGQPTMVKVARPKLLLPARA